MRIALTGGAKGIGAAVVAKMKAQGHSITSFDIIEPDGVDVWIKTDLSDPASIEHALNKSSGVFDALINNAGLPPRAGLAEQVLRVNWFGLVQLLDGMVPHLAPEASIVNVASRAGAHWRDQMEQVQALRALDINHLTTFISKHGIDATRAYNLSKEAVIVMTIARTQEMIARGLRMNAVSPAAVKTGILDDFLKAFGPKVAANIACAGRAGSAEEVAEVITFLASPQSHWIKGQDITIDGGVSAMALADQMTL